MNGPFKHLIVEPHGETCRVAINRPMDRNAINSEVMEELTCLLEDMEKTDFRVVVFTGSGNTHFIGGADGIEMMQCDKRSALAFSQKIQALFLRMEASPLVLVAAINGLCFGGGFEFAMACDLRVATENARIGLPEVKVGLIPGGGGTQRLPWLVGAGRAMEMILSGRLYKGSDAAEMGLVHWVVKKDGLQEGVEKLLKPILRQPQYALSLAKKAVHASRSGSLNQGLNVESKQFSRCFDHDFFPDLMKKQLQDGVLETTADVSKLMGKGEGE
ncbi:putative 3-hydroxybutyryl-CoA dehydratase [delta proteobacterium NaphS2]|nr:putative 3-hydroxybutyryl-CoA dehydratase [delta proteobacterium NaphS2]